MIDNKLYCSLIVLCLCICSQISRAQVNADFTSNAQSGCSPLVVNFTNQSSGNIVDYLWKFGNNNSSNLENPSATYISPGNYTVTLIVYGSGGQVDSIVKQNFITIYSNPQANFSASRTHTCLGNSIDFTDASNQGSSQIVNWQWDFGDGNTSTQQNPTHTYQNLGEYTVSLELTDANGCSHFLFKDDYIKITTPPQANFVNLNPNGCSPPHAAEFSNLSSGTAPFSSQWDFGDGNTSNQENPTHIYNSFGNYDVKLLVTDQSGCSDSITLNNIVSVEEPLAQISVNTNYGCSNPATVFQFSNQSTGPGSFVRWDFGDNTITSSQNPNHVYSSEGIYTVMLISGNNTCRDTTTEQIYVQQLSADFTADQYLACEVPFDVNFTDNSNNAVSWDWNFGNGTTSNQQNPSTTYNLEGDFEVELSITDTLGCINTFKESIKVDFPSVSIDSIIGDYCIPVQALFTPTVTTTDPAQSFLWNFGNGDTAQSPVAQYTYTDTGTFAVSVNVTTTLGCEATDTLEIEIGDKSTVFDASFVDSGTGVCRQGKIELDIWADFAENFIGQVPGDMPYPLTIVDSNAYGGDSEGNLYTPIIIQGVFNGCASDEFIFQDSIYLEGPYCVKVFHDITCDKPYEVAFDHTSINYTSTNWDFGDGNTSTDPFPVHTYAARGEYFVKLILFDAVSGCTFEKEDTVNIYDPIASFSMTDSVGCGPLQISLQDNGSQDAVAFFWQGNSPDLNSTGSSIPNASLNQGDYSVSLIVQDVYECTDTSTKDIKVYGHSNSINASATSGCAPITVDFEGIASADTSIASYLWNIDGNAFTDSAISYEFTSEGNYTVALRTTDYFGCSASSNIVFTAADPQANFVSNKQVACISENVTFVDLSNPSSGLTYQWDFGDSTGSTQRIPTHQYGYNDTFTVSLIVSDQYGCTDTVVKPEIVRTSSPEAAFAVSDTFGPCPPLFVNFTSQSSSDAVNWSWRFGDNSGASIENPGHSYNRPGSFDVRLIVTNNDGCRDTAFVPDQITVGGPTGSFTVNPPEGCRPLTSEFFISNAVDVAQITWDFGNGFSANGDSAKHTYTNSGIYYPNVVLLNDNNCSFSYERIDTVVVDTLIADFALSENEACVPANITVSNISEGSVVNWSWNVDGTDYSTSSIPQQAFESIGDYDVKLMVENSRGCLDSISKTITVHPLPVVEISGDTFLCENLPGELYATEDANFNYQWIPSIGLDDVNAANPSVSLNSQETFRVIVTDQNGCVDTSNAHSISVFPKLQLEITSDTTIVMGDTARLRPAANQEVTGISWTPNSSLTCDDCFWTDAFPLDPITYTVTASDTVGCYEKSATIEIEVIDDIQLAMPEAFTPNADDINDALYVKGWNIKELVYFRIFNRWGELIFETNDLNEGWDGTYKGEMQNMDSYAYVIKAISHKDREGELRGSVSLIR